MKTLKFKCTLLSDVIINQKSATEGNNETLDFIPGSNFLGIVASHLYEDLSSEESMMIFHSGKVRFGDAHPAKDGKRSLKVPASMFYPKMKKAYLEKDKLKDVNYKYELYIHHNIPDKILKSEKFKEKQLKQCRSGFCIFNDNEAKQTGIEKTFAIKSAYDRDKRRSKDKAMYGYESLNKGTEFFFTIEIDNDDLEERIKNAILGEKHIGRSRTAQYGLVKIEKCDFNESESRNKKGDFVTVYADSRLTFLDENGNATFRPSIAQLGLKSGEILWEKSQIRTFQYSPWNFKRQCYDTDRCGIEKGSVFVIKGCTDSVFTSQYIGSYKNEGFGKVIYNPDFLNSKEEGNGEAVYIILENEKEKKNDEKKEERNARIKEEIENLKTDKDDGLLLYFADQKQKELKEESVYEMVNNFVIQYAATEEEKKKDASRRNIFSSESFASQWGTIRSIAMKCKTKAELESELFTKTINKNGQTVANAYLTHGVAKDKWEERGRKKTFEEFFYNKLTDDNAQIAIINLAAQMAKRCRNNGK